MGDYQPLKRDVRQGCVLSPDLFSRYSEKLMRNIKKMPGMKVNGDISNNIRYADDTILLSERGKDLQVLADNIVSEYEKMRLGLNEKKTETMVI